MPLLNHLVYLPASEADFMAEDAVPILNHLSKAELDEWIPRLIRAKRSFAIDSVELLPPESLNRLAETTRRRKLAVAILHSYRLLPIFARLKELLASNCLGTLRDMQISIPQQASLLLCMDLAAWLCQNQLEPSPSATDNNRITLHTTSDNGFATAWFDVTSNSSELTVQLCGTTRTVTIPYAEPILAEKDILANTIPYKHRWPLLMHAQDTVNAMSRLPHFMPE
ncbi:MAG: hypothetical protein J6X49_05325 [Victivallales bacterium]|nr:hypothetical protein [Victivallales bacterium]